MSTISHAPLRARGAMVISVLLACATGRTVSITWLLLMSTRVRLFWIPEKDRARAVPLRKCNDHVMSQSVVCTELHFVAQR